MNFPCDNCKAIRAFSGEPPKCEVCGWECGVSSGREADAPLVEPVSVWTGEEKVGRRAVLMVSFWGVLIVGAIYLLAQFLAPGRHPDILTPGRYQLALKYNLTEDQVFMDPKPTNCDFSVSPVGDKHCHFEQSLNVVRECVSLSGAPAAPEANCPVKRVYVSWRKVPD